MWWYPLGHAMALAEADGLRLLFDPLLDNRHHGGVFEVAPPRTVHAEALRSDFLVLSHRHPDHFDVPSLRRLSALDDETVVLTADALVARVCKRLGFRTVRHVAPSTRVELDTIRLITTPSVANETPIHPEALEWGVALTIGEALVWNQVDTVHRSVDDLQRTMELIESQLAGKLRLTLTRWSPLLEIEASLAGRIGFPFAGYGDILAQAAAIARRGSVVVPSSAGGRHAAPYAAMNALVYPVDEARFVRDLGAMVPEARVVSATVGGGFAIDDDVHFEPDAARNLVTAHPFDDDRDFRPLAIPPLVDRAPSDRAMIDAWVRGPLVDALARYPYRFLLEVVHAAGVDVYALANGAVTREHDPRWDVRNEVAASLLCEVIAGTRHWGDLLLAGALRACTRAYEVRTTGLLRANVPPIFLYAALSYSASVERAVEHELSHE